MPHEIRINRKNVFGVKDLSFSLIEIFFRDYKTALEKIQGQQNKSLLSQYYIAQEFSTG
jgi:hypothetical protein